MMRMLAWCGISQSMSASVLPALASVARAASSSTPHRQLEDRLAVHLQQRRRRAPGRRDTCPGTHRMPTCLPSACRSLARMPGVVAGLEHHRAGAVAEQHAGGAVVEIEDARKHFGADHQRLAGAAGADHRVGHGQRIDEAAADRLHVEGRRSRRCPACAAGCAAVDGNTMSGVEVATMIRSMSAALRPAASSAWRAASSARSLLVDVGRGEMARADAGALDDPLVGGLDAARRQFARPGRRWSRGAAAGSCRCR